MQKLEKPFKQPEFFQLKRHGDSRGFFLETFSPQLSKKLGLRPGHFLQDNHSYSKKGVLRGMHYQTEPGQDKLVYVASGTIYDVFVDIREQSPSFGQWQGFTLSAENGDMLFIPHGFAHGFVVTSEDAHVLYKVSNPYCPATEKGFDPLDSSIGIKWPSLEYTLSDRDKQAPSFALAPKL